MIDKKKAAWGIVVAFGVVILLSLFAHCSTTTKRNSIGVVMQANNPLTYLAGDVTNVEFGGDPENYGMVLRVQPIGTYTLYTEDVLLCGNPADMFQGKSSPLVLVYETRARHTVSGIGCHELKAVLSLEAK
jgi:hypothetical protein